MAAPALTPQQRLAQFVYEILFLYFGKLLTVALKFEQVLNRDQQLEIIIANAVLANNPVWPDAARTLHSFLAANASVQQIRKVIDALEKEQVGMLLFPLFWVNPVWADIRHSQLLSFIVKWCARRF
jgi:hypothetical protein